MRKTGNSDNTELYYQMLKGWFKPHLASGLINRCPDIYSSMKIKNCVYTPRQNINEKK